MLHWFAATEIFSYLCNLKSIDNYRLFNSNYNPEGVRKRFVEKYATFENIMNKIHLSHLTHLHEASVQNKLVVFVGAGVSANSGVPTWSSLTNAFKEDLPDTIKKETDDLKVAQIYKDTYGRKAYFEKVRNVLKDGRVAYNPIHNAILELNPVHIITTNYDDLIEQSIQSNYKQYDIITQDSDLPYYRYPSKVVKMHGDFKTGNIVLTEEDYYNYAATFPLIRSFVTSLFTTNVVLFVGFSFSDLNLKIILNDIKTILDQDMQRVYLLTDERVDKELSKYYENKGINIVDICDPDSYVSDYDIKIEAEKLKKLSSSKGKNLYKQLRIIHYIDKDFSDDLLTILYSRLKSAQTELPVLGDGLRYLFPNGSYRFWNYHSNGLQLHSRYFEELNDKLKNYNGKKAFVAKHPKEQRLLLMQQAYVNQIYEIDRLQIITDANYVKIQNSFDEKHPIDYFYNLDFTELYNTLGVLEKKGINYDAKDLFLPYLLCRLGRFYDAYQKYKVLLPEFWNKELYVLYFITLYNLFHIRNRIPFENINKPDIDADSIINEIEQFDLDTILLKLPIDNALKNTLKDLVSYRLFSEKSKDADELSRQIHRQKKHADKGGASLNSNIYSLLTKFQRTINFCLSNCIEFNNPYFPNLVKDTITGILNSHITCSNKLFAGMEATKIDVLNKSHLFILLFFINTNELLELFKQYDVQEIKFDKDAIEEFDNLISNLYQSLNDIGRNRNLSFSIEIINNIIGNMVYLIGKSNNTIPNKSSEKLYSIIHDLWCPALGRTLENVLYVMVNKCPPTNEMAMNLLEDSILLDPFRSEYLARVVKEQLMQSNLVFDRIKDVSVFHRNSDGQLGLTLYDVLPKLLQEQFVEYAQQHTSQLLRYLIIIDKAQVRISDVDYFEKLLKTPNYTSGFKKEQLTRVCWFIAKMRKNSLYSNVYSIIDNYGNKYEQYQFYLNPLDYKKMNQVDVDWLLGLEDSEIIELSKNDEIRIILKNAVLSKRLDEREANRIIRLLM